MMRAYSNYYNCSWVKLEEASGNYIEHRALSDCLSTLRNIWRELGLGVKESVFED